MALLNIDLTGFKGLSGSISQESYKTTPEVHLNYSADEGEMADGVFNPLMRPGYLYPANDSALAMSVPTISDDWRCAYADPQTGLILGNQDDNFYRYDDSFTVGLVTYDYENDDGVKIESVAASNNVNDIKIYQVNGTKKVFYLNGNNVGIASTSLGSIDNDWLSTVCSGGSTLHGTGLTSFMRKSDNGLLYVFDQYAVHSIDGTTTGGTNGTAVMDVLVFPDGIFEIVDAVDNRGRLYIAINDVSNSHTDFDDKTLTQTYVSTAGVYVWNRISTVVSMQDFITIESCLRIQRLWVGPNGELFLMTIGSNGQNQIRVLSGSKFVVVKELPFESKISQLDGLLVAEGMTWWAGVDGWIYAGRMIDGNFCVYKIVRYYSGTLASATGTVLAFLGGNSFGANTGYRSSRPSLVIAYRPDGGNALVKRYFIYGVDSMTDTNGSDGTGFISPNPYLFTPNQGDVFTGVKLLPTMSTVRNVVIRCIPTSSASTTIATIKYYFNGSTTASVTKTVTMQEASKGYISHAINKAYCNSIQMEIEWNTANTMGVNDFAPYLATVEYEATNTYSPESD